LITCGGFDNNGVGATWIFVKDTDTDPNTDPYWVQYCPKLVGNDSTGLPYQGYANGGCSISKNGITLVVGGQFNDSSKGAAWIFAKDP
jgi:hypothetical protein